MWTISVTPEPLSASGAAAAAVTPSDHSHRPGPQSNHLLTRTFRPGHWQYAHPTVHGPPLPLVRSVTPDGAGPRHSGWPQWHWQATVTRAGPGVTGTSVFTVESWCQCAGG